MALGRWLRVVDPGLYAWLCRLWGTDRRQARIERLAGALRRLSLQMARHQRAMACLRRTHTPDEVRAKLRRLECAYRRRLEAADRVRQRLARLRTSTD